VPKPRHLQQLDLTAQESAALDAYAQAHGLTPEQAATKLAQQTLAARYRLPKQQGRVLPFRRRP
jgi:hypothetical protein